MALYASMAMILPLKSSSLTGVLGMRSLKFTPKIIPRLDKAVRFLNKFVDFYNFNRAKGWTKNALNTAKSYLASAKIL
jgi:hypothetical protein